MRSFLGHVLLRHPQAFQRLRQLPVLGSGARWIGEQLLPRDEMVWAHVQNGHSRGLWLKLNPRTGATFFQGQGEPAVQQALVERLRPGMVFYDVGANIGFFSLLAARRVGAGGAVFAFEPEPALAPRLRENIARNGFPQVTVVEAAAWSRSGQVSFQRTPSTHSADYGLGHVAEQASALSISVPALALDDFIREHPIPDLIKCDAEGAEVDVFRGAENLLRARRATIICELHSPENEATLRDLFAQHGYAVARLDVNHLLALPRA